MSICLCLDLNPRSRRMGPLFMETKLLSRHYVLPRSLIISASPQSQEHKIRCLLFVTVPSIVDLTTTMFGVLLRFREGPLAAHAIIEEEQLSADDLPVDRARMKQLDPADPANHEQIFKLLRESLEKVSVKVGKEKKPKENKKKKVGGKNPVERQIYNEEYFDSFKTMEEGKRTVERVIKYYQQARSICGNFVTNSGALKKAICDVQPLDGMIKSAATRWINESDGHAGNLVDVYWDTKNDFLDFRIRIKEPFDFGELPSRKEVLELVSRLNDPLGLMSNTTIILKMLLQELDQSSAPWDGQITGRSKLMWNTWLVQVGISGYNTIPRSLTMGCETKHQLHAFAGASTTAIATCVYLRGAPHQDGPATSIGLAAAASEVTPINQPIVLTEFKAAVLAARLVKQIQDETRLKLQETILWTDSQLVLDGIRNPPSQRHATTSAKKLIEAVLGLTKPHQWRLIPSDQNPAHAATVVELLD